MLDCDTLLLVDLLAEHPDNKIKAKVITVTELNKVFIIDFFLFYIRLVKIFSGRFTKIKYSGKTGCIIILN